MNSNDPSQNHSDSSDTSRSTVQVWIDRRPIFLVIVSRFRKQLIGALLLALFLGALSLDPPTGLKPDGYRVMCLFGLCVVLWASNLIPLSITSLVAMAGVPLLTDIETAEAYRYFGHPVVFFVLGAFILGAVVVSCGLSTRIAVWVLGRFGRTPRRLVLAIYGLCAGLSCFMSEHAVAAMMFPIVVELVRGLNLKTGRSPMAKAMFLAMAWGCIIGGTLTVLGGGRGPLAIGFLEEATANTETISFLGYIAYGLPLVLILLAVGALALWVFFPPEISSVDSARERLHRQVDLLGKISWREQGVALVLLTTIGGWILLGHGVGMANIAICGVAALFVLRLASWREVEENVNWGIILTYGGAICLAGALMSPEIGAKDWITQKLALQEYSSPTTFLLVVGALVVILTEFMSNSAVIAILMPMALAIAPAEIDPRAVTMAVVLPSNFAFMLPMATPATALSYSSGAFRPFEVMRFGLLLDLAGYLSLVFLVTVYWPATGLL